MLDQDFLDEFKDFIESRFCRLDEETLDRICWRWEDDYYADEWENAYWDLVPKLEADWEEHGCTKIVFAFYEYPQYVVKIPFKGVRRVDYEGPSSEDWLSEARYSADYCQLEADLYLDAMRDGIQSVFAEVRFLTKISDIPIYVAERCNGFSSVDSDVSEQSRTISSEIIHSKSDSLGDIGQFLGEIVEQYGEDFAKKVVHFTDEYDIDDIHEGNVGWSKDEKFKLIDYSNYFDW